MGASAGAFPFWLFLIALTAVNWQVVVSTIMYSFCEELRTTYWQPPEVEYPEEDLIILETRPLWDNSPTADVVVWIEMPFRFNLPVYAVPATAFTVSNGGMLRSLCCL